MGSPPQNHNWVFDYGVLEDIPVPGGDLPPLDLPGFTWPSHSFVAPAAPSVDFDDSFGNSDSIKESGCRKRVRSGSCNVTGSKACREKMRRDRLNDRFLELSSMLEPGRPPKTDKAAILGDAVRVVNQLRGEAQQLKDSNGDLQEKINELKAEKNELRDEKQRLKTEKENIERQIKALNTQPGFLPHPAAIPGPFSAPGQVVGGKLMPFVGYPGVSMWQFMPPAAVDTSQDHVLRPPVA
ncbi:PREDICTED: transcription factor ILR3-like [Prunus mume]|uniref:Transcription factor ILR3-like n=1 Tax=Prunus mume TaxID=102107 RepID=A0ABM0NHH6_PRUMU|nr:PREDICTED: transcription factor ILR3-like [Prunus mume]